jgi:hypothetical protein
MLDPVRRPLFCNAHPSDLPGNNQGDSPKYRLNKSSFVTLTERPSLSPTEQLRSSQNDDSSEFLIASQRSFMM